MSIRVDFHLINKKVGNSIVRYAMNNEIDFSVKHLLNGYNIKLKSSSIVRMFVILHEFTENEELFKNKDEFIDIHIHERLELLEELAMETDLFKHSNIQSNATIGAAHVGFSAFLYKIDKQYEEITKVLLMFE